MILLGIIVFIVGVIISALTKKEGLLYSMAFWCMGIGLMLFSAGMERMELKKAAITAGVAHWEIDAQSGEKTFEYNQPECPGLKE